MNKYEKYDLEDFASDDDFISWCLQPDEASNSFWNNWIENHPNQKSTLLKAKQLILDLQGIEAEEHTINFETEIWENIDSRISTTSIKKKTPKIRRIRWGISAAACVLLLICTFFFYNKKSSSNKNTFNIANTQWINFENNSGITKTIELADGSKVILEPFSTLKYPTDFSTEQRTVFLKGEAFFDIERDTLKPFLVYANETITKVLGTSFRIIAFEGQETVEVEVKTGKVAVYAKVASDDVKKENRQMLVQTDEKIFVPTPNKKLEVTPNQKVVFDRKVEVMNKTVTTLPLLIKEVRELPQFHFENEPAIKVFEALEQAYGIDLEFDKEQLKDCTIRTTLNNESLFQKLEIICAALDLKFSEKDAVIYIEGNGC